MPLSKENSVHNAKQLLGELAAYIAKTEMMLDARETVSLVDLNDAVDVLCARIVALDAHDARRFAKDLDELTQHLSKLQQRMTEQQEQVALSLQSLGKSRKATKAYLNAPES